MMNDIRFHEFLNDAFLESGKTDREIADELKCRGFAIHYSTLWRWKTGRSVPKIKNLSILQLLPDLLALNGQKLATYKRFMGRLLSGRDDLRGGHPLNYRRNFVSGQSTFFTGRQPEITQLTAALEARRNIFISGLPGVGKTSLAWKLMEDNVENYAYGYDSIRVGPQHSLSSIVALIGRRLGAPIPFEYTNSDVNMTIEYLSSWAYDIDMLFLLDNVYSLEQVEELIVDFPAITWIVTSRKKLFSVTANFESLNIDPPPADQAVEILLHYAQVENGAETRQIAGQISERLGNLPVTLRVAGGMLATGFFPTLQKLHQQLLEKGFGILQASRWDIYTFLDSLFNEMAHSDDLRGVIACCGAFQFPRIRLNALEAVIKRIGLSGNELGVLGTIHFIQWSDDGKYVDLHPLIHEFAAHQLNISDYAEKIRLEFTQYFSHYAGIVYANHKKVLADYENLQKAAEFAIDKDDWQQLRPLWSTLTHFIWMIGDWAGYKDFDEKCVAVARSNEATLYEGIILSEIGWVYLEEKDYRLAKEYFLNAYDIFVNLPDAIEHQVRVSRYLAILYIEQSELEDAESELKKAATIVWSYAFDIGEMRPWIWATLALIAHNQAKLAVCKANYIMAEKMSLKALHYCRRSDNVRYLPMVEQRLGEILLHLGKVQNTRDIWRKIIGRNYQGQDIRVVVETQMALAELERDCGNDREALYWAQVAENKFSELGLAKQYSQALNMVKDLHANMVLSHGNWQVSGRF